MDSPIGFAADYRLIHFSIYTEYFKWLQTKKCILYDLCKYIDKLQLHFCDTVMQKLS